MPRLIAKWVRRRGYDSMQEVSDWPFKFTGLDKCAIDASVRFSEVSPKLLHRPVKERQLQSSSDGR
jgi:hypothetical protein